jgi:hypothetical protein
VTSSSIPVACESKSTKVVSDDDENTVVPYGCNGGRRRWRRMSASSKFFAEGPYSVPLIVSFLFPRRGVDLGRTIRLFLRNTNWLLIPLNQRAILSSGHFIK